MARTLVIDSIEAAGRSFSSGEELVIDPQLKKFIVNFRRSDNYVGDYGFDWLRDEYIHPIVKVATDHDGNPLNAPLALCDDVAALKKEYKTTDVTNPISPYGKDYYPAWLSMFPDTPEANASHKAAVQSYGVYLNLEIEEYEPLACDPTELIFEPSSPNLEVILKTPKLLLYDLIFTKMKDIKWDGSVQRKTHIAPNIIKIKCHGELNKHEEIKVFAKLREQKVEVGKLMVFKNSNYKELQFDITPVRILRKGSKTADKNTIENQIDTGFGDVTKPIADDLKNLERYLNLFSLNQALLKANIGNVYDVEIDESQWIADDLIVTDTKVFKGGQLLEKFHEELKKQHKELINKRGIIVYLAPLAHIKSVGTKGAGGYADLYNIDAKHCVIFHTNLDNEDSFAHEIAHVAGLEHSFIDPDDLTDDQVFGYNKRKKEIDDFFEEAIKSGEYSKIEIAEFWNDYKGEMRHINSKLYTYYRNLHKFKIGSTENIMDYYVKRVSFWKFQWKALQEDIQKFYTEK
ncbi:MAG: hypothetical protein ACTIJ9_11125 [Aequorivita sp.]